MGYSVTHFFYFFRKHVLRRESRTGNFKRIIWSTILAVCILVSGRFIPERLDESLLLKSLFALRGSIPTPSNLLLVDIDDVSYQKLGLSPRKPFPREVSARAVRSILKDKPKILVLDLFYPYEEDEMDSAKVVSEAFREGVVSIAKPPIGDFVSSTNYVGDSAEEFQEDEELLQYGSDPDVAAAATYELPMTLSELYGYVMFMNINIGRYSASSVYNHVPLLEPLHDHISSDLPAPERSALINFYGPAGTIRSFSFWELFEDNRLIPEGFFKDKVVVLGFKSDLRGRGHSDKEILGVPVRSKGTGYGMYGMEIHANIIGNLLESSWISSIEYSHELLLKLFLLWFLILGIVSFHPVYSLIYACLYLSLWFVSTYAFFAYKQLFIPGVFLALLYSPFIIAGAATISATIALKELKKMKETFGTS